MGSEKFSWIFPRQDWPIFSLCDLRTSDAILSSIAHVQDQNTQTLHGQSGLTMSSEGPYGRQGFQSNPGGYGGGGASYGADAGQSYAQPQYRGGASYGGGGASYGSPPPQQGAYGADYNPYGAQMPADYQVRNEWRNGDDCRPRPCCLPVIMMGTLRTGSLDFS